MLCGTGSQDLFRAYQTAQTSGIPMVICQGPATDKAGAAIKEMAGRNASLSQAFYVGHIDESYLQPLDEAGIKTEEVRA